jgi:TonB-dependent receptor
MTMTTINTPTTDSSKIRRMGPLHSASLLILATMASAAQARAADAPASAPSVGTPLSEVIVTGKRSGTKESALAEKRDDVSVTSIMSAEEIAERPGATIVDVITHLPGLSGFSDMGLGQAATGQAEYATIRGIDSSYNAYTLNDVRVPQADPNSRALSLKLVPPYGIEAVKVVKTPTPDMEGDAIGGIIDIRTPNAFDFPGSMFKVSLDGNLAGLASDLGVRSAGGGGQVEMSRKFNENFGVYLAGYYDTSNSAGEAVETLGYIPTLFSQAVAAMPSNTPAQKAQQQAALAGLLPIGSQTTYANLSGATGGLSPTGVRWDYYNNYITRFGANGSLDYRTADQQLYIEASYAGYRIISADTQHAEYGAIFDGFSNPADPFNPLAPNKTTPTATYSPQGLLPGSYWQERNQHEDLVTTKVGGATKLDRLTLTYDVSVGYSDILAPNYVQASLYGFPSVTGSDLINVSNPAHIGITFDSPATQAYAFNPSVDHVWKYQGQNEGSSNLTWGAKFDARYNVDRGVLAFVQAGVDINLTHRAQYNHPFFTDGPFGFGGGGQNFVVLGNVLANGQVFPAGGVIEPLQYSAGPSIPNVPGYNVNFGNGNYPGLFRIYSASYFEHLIIPYAYTSQFGVSATTGQPAGNPGTYTTNDFNNQTVNGDENIYAGYAEANLKYRNWSALVGFRYEETAFNFSDWMDQTATNGQFVKTSRSYGEFLPSLLVTWRPDPSMVLRADIRESFSRPAFGLFANPISVSVNPLNNNQIVAASEGNPNLKPATSLNYDVAAEFYGAHGDIIEVNAYYKDIHNFVFPALVSGGFPSSMSGAAQTINGVLISMPENGASARLYGAELNVRHKLVELPGPLSGFGLGGSLTLQHSSANPNLAGHVGATWLPRAPRIIYNLDIFYEKYGVKSALSYQYVGEQLDGISGNYADKNSGPIPPHLDLDEYLQPQKSLDFSISYPIHGILLGFSAKNLLNDIEFYKTLGKGTRYLGTQDGGGNGSWVETGRFFTLSASYRF